MNNMEYARRWHAGTLAIYAFLSWATLDHGASLTRTILGAGADPGVAIWFLKWWPWSIAHHIDPLHTDLFWQPSGVNLMWTTSLPLMALLGLPFTLLAGPAVAFNILTLAAPVLGAWSAYFLCLHISKHPLAAAFGGYLFGFSSYEMAQTIDHLNLDWIVFLPCFALVALRRVDGSLGRVTAIVLASLLLAAQFLTSIEIFATTILVSALVWLMALIWLNEQRQRLRAVLGDAMIAGVFALALVSPMLWAMFSTARDTVQPASWPKIYSADFLNLFMPTNVTAMGGAIAQPISGRFTGGLEEQGGYLGLPLIVILVRFFQAHRGSPDGKFLMSVFVVVLVISLGAGLWVGGVFTGLVLPWRLLVRFPLIGSALPTRFTLYLSLVAAVIASLSLARHPARKIIPLLACLALVPARHPVTRLPDLEFFQPGRPQAVLGPDPRVLILPFAINGQSTYWQQQSDFAVRQTGGYVGFPPVAMQIYPAVLNLFLNRAPSDLSAEIASFCLATDTQYLIAGPGISPPVEMAVNGLGWPSRRVDDVLVYTVPGIDRSSTLH